MLTSLKPLSLLLTFFYTLGSPLCGYVRPASLDAPLIGFHEDVVTVMTRITNKSYVQRIRFEAQGLINEHILHKVDVAVSKII